MLNSFVSASAFTNVVFSGLESRKHNNAFQEGQERHRCPKLTLFCFYAFMQNADSVIHDDEHLVIIHYPLP